MNNPYISRKGLNDTKIIQALRKAADDYENGEIAEVSDTLQDIVWAIKEYDMRCEENGACL